MVPAFADDFRVAYDDRAEGAAVSGMHAISGELDGAPHEFLFHGDSIYFPATADKVAGICPAFAYVKNVVQKRLLGLVISPCA